ncbi:hypothetical protein [Marinobacter mobilis]|uniref:Phosphate ABC transporter substrate-binding protein n=1 Tax=Marinobacter mobilis TaxID=488533 RepID=A0A1H3CBV8_9GAMM|nr:hypothetical protein [Marinobacter mobilis]SDW73884.1 hypothetical protein SAMN04487960_10412 [Marinobacter mobilis]SDX51530.1 hypothetical protein SAMN04487960_110111 [Marinobacter mobilis]
MKTAYALLSLLLLATSVPAFAEQLVVVAGPDSDISRLSIEELSDLYLGKRSTDHEGRQLTVYDLDDLAVRSDFCRSALSMSLLQLRAYRAKQVFTGRGRPPRQLAVEELIERVKNNPQAIGYLPRDRAGGLTIVHSF